MAFIIFSKFILGKFSLYENIKGNLKIKEVCDKLNSYLLTLS